MAEPDTNARVAGLRSRREPPPLLAVRVTQRREVTPRLLRVTFEGDGLDAMLAEPAASVRLLVPSPGAEELVLPEWNGNEFLLADGRRPALRTFTPLTGSADAGLDLEIVRHPGGAVSTWAETVRPGAPAAVSGPGRGFTPPPEARRYHLLGDETAAPAIGQLIEELPEGVSIAAQIEVEDENAVRPLPERDAATVAWLVRRDRRHPGRRLVDAAEELPDLTAADHVWAAGEAASMQAIRTHLFDERGLPRGQATVRGYWKPARRTG